MNTAVINIRTDEKVKSEAKKIAAELGLSLSTAINLFLKQFVRTRGMAVSLDETPNAYMQKMLRESEADIKAGRVRSFENPKDAIKWLKKDED